MAKATGFINDIKYSERPCGGIEGKYHYHHPFKYSEEDYFNKHHKNYFRNTDGIPEEYDRYFKQHHTSVTVDMNNLGNFNPTRGSEATKFEHTETEKHLHYEKSKPRYNEITHKNTEIVDKINDMKKPQPQFSIFSEHSQRLNIRRL
jgi:hypothetical protein